MRQKNSPRDDVAKRKSAPLERVKPLTLSHLARTGVKEIDVECEWCRHSAKLEIAALIKREGEGALFREIVRRLRCSVCGWNRVDAFPVRSGARPQRRGPGPLPPLSECRALLEALRVDPNTEHIARRGVMIGALRERWPELTASTALFIVQQLRP